MKARRKPSERDKSFHIEKWKAVCEEMQAKYPECHATMWVSGYVFGMLHAAEMED